MEQHSLDFAFFGSATAHNSKTIWTLKVERRCMLHKKQMQFMQNVRMHLRTKPNSVQPSKNSTNANELDCAKTKWKYGRKIDNDNQLWVNYVARTCQSPFLQRPWIIWILAMCSCQMNRFYFLSGGFTFSLIERLLCCRTKLCGLRMQSIQNECAQHAWRTDKIEYY